uniref:Uncharacterized protein n=1 Tax=Lotus japonicus TaxID=34305 RepID=I3T9D8_LOTJA|nr:unknown [Lotus japonicus]
MIVNLFTVMFAWIVLSSRKLWTGSSMRLMFCRSLMGVMMVPLGRCCNMHGSLDHSTNQWSWQNLTGLQLRSLLHGPLILGAWVV